MSGFIEPRSITVVHAALWEAIEEWGKSRGIELVLLFPATEDREASYMFAPIYKNEE